jgi:hypothetical protein
MAYEELQNCVIADLCYLFTTTEAEDEDETEAKFISAIKAANYAAPCQLTHIG